jgi:hypothetical protein
LIIMLLGVAGLVAPRRGYGWMRRQMVLRRGPDGRPVASFRRQVPRYVMIDPAASSPDAATAAGRIADTGDEDIVEDFLPQQFPRSTDEPESGE